MLRPCTKLALAILLLPAAGRTQTQNLFLQWPIYPSDGSLDQGLGPIVTADFNNDGKPDIVAQDGTVSLGSGDGTFREVAKWSTSLADLGPPIAVGDFKSEAIGRSSGQLFICLSNGDGTFAPCIVYQVGSTGLISPSRITAADVNGDRRPGGFGLFVSEV